MLIFEKSVDGRRGVVPPQSDVPEAEAIPPNLLRTSRPTVCELSELDVVRHFTELSRKNYGVDTNFYPLGSCTMKYNPKVNEKIASLEGFADLHPMLVEYPGGERLVQGALRVVCHLEELLCEVTGMDAFTLQPLAGAHGELTGMMLIAAYHRARGQEKDEVLIPDEAHGTNPSSAIFAGFKVRSVPTDCTTGTLDIEALRKAIGPRTAAIMLTNPNTLGIFNARIQEIAQIAHENGALLYYDGANLNAILGRFRPGDGNFDVMHVNVHKTFSTPHGGGGPGAGPVGVKKHLIPFLPTPRVVQESGSIRLRQDYPHSIGRVAPFFGNFGILLRAYSYIVALGKEGLRDVSAKAVLHANYIMHSLKDVYEVPYLRTCMHECVLSARRQTESGVRALDIAKALIDRGFHPPSIYFPLIVKEAMMIEPTETESKETLDAFISVMKDIAEVAKRDPKELHAAPVSTPVGRLDEAKAAKEMDFRYCGE